MKQQLKNLSVINQQIIQSPMHLSNITWKRKAKHKKIPNLPNTTSYQPVKQINVHVNFISKKNKKCTYELEQKDVDMRKSSFLCEPLGNFNMHKDYKRRKDNPHNHN